MSDRPAEAPVNVEPLAQSPTETDLPRVPAYHDADFPILVAMGLPDSTSRATVILIGRYENRVASCMRDAGFDYEPETSAKAEARNDRRLNALPLEQRAAWFSAYHGGLPGDHELSGGCAAQASAATYFFNALGDVFGPYASTIMADPKVSALLAEYEACAARQKRSGGTQNTDPVVSVDGCSQDDLEAAKAVARRSAEIAFLDDHWDEFSQFAASSAQADAP